MQRNSECHGRRDGCGVRNCGFFEVGNVLKDVVDVMEELVDMVDMVAVVKWWIRRKKVWM